LTAIKNEAAAAATCLAGNARSRLPVSSPHVRARTPSIDDEVPGCRPSFGLIDALLVAQLRAEREAASADHDLIRGAAEK
jgi:hypothetical protein